MTALLQTWVIAKQRELVPEGSLRARFAIGAFWSVVGAVISRGFLLVASILCARFLGKEGFGALGMIQSTAGMFGAFAGLGLGLTIAKGIVNAHGGRIWANPTAGGGLTVQFALPINAASAPGPVVGDEPVEGLAS